MFFATVLFAFVAIAGHLRAIKDERFSLNLYSKMRISLKHIEGPFGDLVSLLITVGHIATVLMLWVLVKMWDRIHPSFVVIIVVYTICIIVASAILLDGVAKAWKETVAFVTSRQKINYCSDSRKKERFYWFAKWRGQKCMYVKCGNYFFIDSGFTLTYVDTVVGNFVNAVLLFNPK